jgi:YceI-like domain
MTRARLGPDNATLEVRTSREGVVARVGHDLVLTVTSWEATVELGDEPRIALDADPRSLRVREATGGVKPLTDGDRREIGDNIDRKVLGGRPIAFRSSAVRRAGDRLAVEGELQIAGRTAAIAAELEIAPDGRVSGTIPLLQSRWGIKPYRALMGALKVSDEVVVAIEGRLPA